MLASITPLGERGRQSRWSMTVTAFAIGATVAGAALGALAGLAGSLAALATHARLAVLAAVLVVAAALEVLPRSVPGPSRQVNERWLDEYRGWVYGAGFGAQLGLGVTTVVSSAATYVALAAAVLTGSVLSGVVIVGTFGAIRGVTPLLAARVRSPRQLIELHRSLARWAGLVRRGGQAGLAVMAILATAGTLV